MAFSLIYNGISAVGISGGSITGVSTSGADIIIAFATWYSGFGTTAPVISDNQGNGNAVVAIKQTSGGGDGYVAIYYWKNPTTSASHNFTLTGIGSYSCLGIRAYSGSHLTAPLDQTSGAGNNSVQTIKPGSVTPTSGQNDELVVSIASSYVESSASSIDSGFGTVDFAHAVDAYSGNISAKIKTSGTAEDLTWTHPNSVTATCAAVATFMTPTGGGGGGGVTYPELERFGHRGMFRGMHHATPYPELCRTKGGILYRPNDLLRAA